MQATQSSADRLFARLVRKPTGCIEWTGGLDSKGYGSIRVNSKTVGTHRLAWTVAHGPISNGMNVLHRCDNPLCCNVEHLFLGTQRDNMADMAAKGRGRGPMLKTHCKQGHQFTETNTYINPSGCPECRRCRSEASARSRRKIRS